MTLKMFAPQVLLGFGAAILIPYMNVFFKYQFQHQRFIAWDFVQPFIRDDRRWDGDRSASWRRGWEAKSAPWW